MRTTGSEMYNFLSIGNDRYGVESFTLGSNGKFVTLQEALNNTIVPLCWAGSHKITLLNHCKEKNLKFYNLDSGYFGNGKTKHYKRISINGFYDTGPIVNRPSDRLDKMDLKVKKFKRGSKIIIIPPDYKKADAARIDPNIWFLNLVEELRQFTDRPIIKRERPLGRDERLISNNFSDMLSNDVYCVIGYQSNALVESIICGIPVISVGDSPVLTLYSDSIKDVESLANVDDDLRHRWLCHLSYRQFSNEEMRSGLAWECLSTKSVAVGTRT